jgi:hypothetical protein
VPKNLSRDELPLKVFVRDLDSNSPFTGYQNKKRKIFYYKTRESGTKINILAKKLNSHFESLLLSFEYNKTTKDKLRLILLKKLSKNIANNKVDSLTNKKRISELRNILGKLEERFVLNEITKEQFDKFTSKYSEELNQLTQEIKSNANSSSNLEKAVEKGLKIVEKTSQL